MTDKAMDNAKGLRIGKNKEHEGAIETIFDLQEKAVETRALLLLLLLLLLFLFLVLLLLLLFWHFLLQKSLVFFL